MTESIHQIKMSFVEDGLPVPDWLNNKFFEKIVRHSENTSDISVSTVEFSSASKVGDNYGSMTYRVRVNYSLPSLKNQQISLILKMLPFSSEQKCFSSARGFNAEMRMYTTFIPVLEQTLRSIGDDTVFAGQLLYHSTTPIHIMVFEDLCATNYVLPTGSNRLGLAGSTLVYKKIAKWHAASYFLSKNGAVNFSEFSVCLFNGNHGQQIDELTNSCADSMKKLLEEEKWPEYERYAEKLDRFVSDLINKGKETIRENSDELGGFNVLNHGDLHNKNVMVKYSDSGIVIDVLLLDYQVTIYGSPALDIGYSMFNLLEEDVRDPHCQQLIDIYHQEFTTVLTRLQCPVAIPSMNDLQLELNRKSFMQVFTWLTFTIFHFASYENYGVGDLFQRYSKTGQAARASIYRQPTVLELCKKYLVECGNKGFL